MLFSLAVSQVLCWLEWQGVGSRRCGQQAGVCQPWMVLGLAWTSRCVPQLWAAGGAHGPPSRWILESAGVIWYQNEVLLWGNKCTPLRDCISRAPALGKGHSWVTAISTTGLTEGCRCASGQGFLFLQPCRHCAGCAEPLQPAAQQLQWHQLRSNHLVPCWRVQTGNWPEHTRLSSSLRWRALLGPMDQKFCL